MTDDDAVDGERYRASHHGLALYRSVACAVRVNRDAKRGERHGGRRTEKSREALWTQDVAEHREGGNDRATNEKADDVLGHLAFFQSLDSDPPEP